MATGDNSINNSIVDYIETMSQDELGTLHSIDLTLKSIARNDGLLISQSSLQDLANVEEQSDKRRDSKSKATNKNSQNKKDNKYKRGQSDDLIDWDKRNGKARADKMFGQLTDDFEDAFKEALFGSAHPLQDALNKSVKGFADSLGTSVQDLGKELGKRAATKLGNKQILTFHGVTNLGTQLNAEKNWTDDKISKLVNSSLNRVSRHLGGTGDVTQPLRPSGTSNPSNPTEGAESRRSAVVAGQGSPDLSDVTNANAGPRDIADATQNVLNESANSTGAQDIVDQVVNGGSASELDSELASAAEGAQSLLPALTDVAEGAGELAPALTGVAGGVTEAAMAFPTLGIAILAAGVAIDALSEAFGPLIDGLGSFGKSVSAAANYDTTKARELLSYQKERIEADSKTIVKAAQDVIEDAANTVTSTWDSVFSTVVSAQGYDKAGVQDLWSSYASDLKEAGLSSVVSSADIMSQLQSILNEGLSGTVAEAFAYEATILNSAIPTEDFFQYASTYATIAANAVKNGASQEEAIQLANSELEDFANNLLYASREVAGGFTTSLSNASSLFASATQIAQTSRIGDISDISGVLTSVSGIVGATVSSEMADTITSLIVSLATGGNSSDLTALRSLAGTGASNTAFLQAFAKDPEGVIETLFRNLSQLQNMSSSNYMEVAEALSSTFGLSIDALARVDFNYLADAVASMNTNSSALAENLELLANGQTTSTDEQLRMQQINEYMIDEGLAYVLDSEVSRAIQQHMWDEQLAQQMMENQFSVDIVGGALELFNGIATTITKIGDVLNPISWIKKATNVALQAVEATQQDDRVSELLNAVKVGSGNATAYHNLTTTGEELGLYTKDSYLEWLTGSSTSYGDITELANKLNSSFVSNQGIKSSLSSIAAGLVSDIEDAVVSKTTSKSKIASTRTSTNAANSYYTHSLISKSQASAMTIGDWKAGQSYNALYANYDESGTTDDTSSRSQNDASALSEAIEKSISEYVASNASQASSLDGLRKVITQDSDSLTQRDKEALEEAMATKLTAEQIARGEQQGLEHRSYYSQDELVAKVNQSLTNQTETAGSFDDWVTQFESQYASLLHGNDLSNELSMYSQTLEEIKAIYEEQETAKSSAETKARELHEVQFWEDMQQFATIDFPWYMREWERYYIQHEAYAGATNNAQTAAIELKDEEQKEFGDSVYALAKALTENSNWQESLGDSLKEPQVQANALLAQILLIVDAIRQQNNETSIVSVPTSLSALGLGVTTTKTK